MKKTGKALIGVLSVAALVGTGVATWTINGGIVTHNEDLVPIIADTIGTRDISLIVTKDEGDTLVFDEPTLEDLEVVYNVKATRASTAEENFDPYDYDYSKITPEYQPNLSVTTQVLRDNSPIEADDPFYDIIALPDEEALKISYKDWLIGKKDIGYDVILKFDWGEYSNFENPQTYVDQNIQNETLDTPEEQRAYFQHINDTLKGISFKFTFKVGGLIEEPSENPVTGEIAIPEIAGSTFTIDGLNGTTVEAGEHTITITTDEGKVVKDNKLTIIEGDTSIPVILEESLTTRATTHTYTYTHNFKENTTYSFTYEVVDEVIPVTQYTIKINEVTNGTIKLMNGDTEVTTGTKVDTDTSLDLTVTANEGYHIASVLIGEESQTIEENSKEYITKVIVTSNLTISATMEADPIETKSLKDLVAEKNTTEEITVLGKVVSVNYSGIVIYDGEVFVPVYLGSGKAADYKIDEYYNITGKLNDRYNWMQFNNGSGDITIEKVNEPQKVIETPEAITLTEEIAANFYENPVQIEAKLVTFSAKAVFDGNYVNFYVEEGGTKLSFVSLPNAIRDTFVEGTTYKINAILNNNNTSGKYLSLDYILHEAVYDSVESVSITNTETELEVGKTLKLTSKVLPETANQEVTYSITSGSEYATLKGDVLTGGAVGVVNIEATSVGNQLITDTFTINIIESTADEYVSVGKYVYNVEPFETNNYGTGIDNESIMMETINNIDIDSSNPSGQITSATPTNNIYKDSTRQGIKFSTGSKNGKMIITTKDQISKIVVNIVAWSDKNVGLTITNGNDNSQTYNLGSTEGDRETLTEWTYEFDSPSNAYTFTASKRFVIASIEFYTK